MYIYIHCNICKWLVQLIAATGVGGKESQQEKCCMHLHIELSILAPIEWLFLKGLESKNNILITTVYKNYSWTENSSI